jgi:hypothetical protein
VLDVFISYSREDQDVAQRLAARVVQEGYSLWWDEDIPPHLAYSEVIAQRIVEAKATIVIWSPSAKASQWVRAEADLAREHEKLIQTSVGGTEPPLPFNQIQFVSIGDWRGEADHPGWRKIRASLLALCGPREAVAPAVAPPPPPSPPAPQPMPLSSPPVSKARVPRLVLGALFLSVAVLIAVGILTFLHRGPVADDTRPVTIGRAGGSGPACADARQARSTRDRFVAVRAGPGRDTPQRDQLSAGQQVTVCDSASGPGGGLWLGIVYPAAAGQDCGLARPAPRARAYDGPCRSGWVASNLLTR